MSLTIAGAVKAYLEAHVNEWKVGASGIPWHRDRPPGGTLPPYGRILEGIGKSPIASGDNGKGGKLRELVQIDIYQNWRSSTNTVEEIPNLADRIAECLEGARLPTAPNVVYGCIIFGGPNRLTDDDNNLVTNTITLNVNRKRI